LTVLAAPTIDARQRLLLFFAFGLATDTQPHPWDSFAPGFRDGFPALFTMYQAFTSSQTAPRQFDGVLDAGIYPILHAPIFGPTNGHDVLLKKLNRNICSITKL
jgi:hypothetical protein